MCLQNIQTLLVRIILSTRVYSSKPAISIEFNDVDINNLAGYEERTRVLYMIHPWKGNPLDAKVPYGQNFAI